MKKVFMSMIALMMAMSVNAQKYLNDSGTPFGEGKFYVGASFSGLGRHGNLAGFRVFNSILCVRGLAGLHVFVEGLADGTGAGVEFLDIALNLCSATACSSRCHRLTTA